MKPYAVFLLLIAMLAGCTAKPAAGNASARNQPTVRDGEYTAAGKITKINQTLGSVELDHGDIPGLMPAMRMEFNLADKSMLSKAAVGDTVDFTVLYKGGTETITKISPSHGNSVR